MQGSGVIWFIGWEHRPHARLFQNMGDGRRIHGCNSARVGVPRIMQYKFVCVVTRTCATKIRRTVI